MLVLTLANVGHGYIDNQSSRRFYAQTLINTRKYFMCIPGKHVLPVVARSKPFLVPQYGSTQWFGTASRPRV